MMGKRVLKHYRFGRTFAWINRHLRSRRVSIEKIRTLYKKIGLVSNCARGVTLAYLPKVIDTDLTLASKCVINVD
jgi:hypothetical protein